MIKLPYDSEQSAYGQYERPTLTELWQDAGSFATDFMASGIADDVTEDDAKRIFLLLYSRYANNTILSSDTNRWKYDLYVMVESYAPNYLKNKANLKRIRNLTDEELFVGTKQINNSAMNPSTPPSTATLEELTAIDAQHTTTFKKGKLDGITMQNSMLGESDGTERFLNHFRRLFDKIVRPYVARLYATDVVDLNETEEDVTI